MKLIARTLVLLSAALLIAGITVALGRSSAAQSLFPTRGRPAMIQAAAGKTTTTSQAQASAPQGQHGDNRSPSLFGAVEILKNLGIMGIIIAVVGIGLRLLPSRRPKGGSRRSQAPPAASPSV